MKKVLLIALVFALVPMLFADGVVRTVDGVKAYTGTSEGRDEPLYRPGNRQQVLYVEDTPYPGSIPVNPDPYWVTVLDSVLGVGNYGWFGPTNDYTTNGPDLATMQGYEAVVWNCYDGWQSPPLTASDRTDIASYLTGGGKVWLIGQDLLWGGVPLAFLTTNFDVASVTQDYGGGFPSGWYWFNGQAEIEQDTFQTMDDWGSDFFPDALTPTANAHHILQDAVYTSYYPSVLRDDYTSSYWTVDGRGPASPWEDWRDVVYTMFDLFGIFGGDINDVGPVSIDITSPLPWNTTLPPEATVKNFGTVMETFDVTCEIDPGAYSSTQTVTDLAAGDSIQVTFTPDFTFAMEDTYTVTVYTQLGGDMDPMNDTLVAYIETWDPGIAEDGSLPGEFSFSASTISRGLVSIQFALPAATTVELVVYDALGRLRETLVSERFSAGTHSVDVQLKLPAGVYFYNMKTGLGEKIMEKLILVD